MVDLERSERVKQAWAKAKAERPYEPELCRTAWRMRIDGMTYQQIADAMGSSLEKARTRSAYGERDAERVASEQHHCPYCGQSI